MGMLAWGCEHEDVGEESGVYAWEDGDWSIGMGVWNRSMEQECRDQSLGIGVIIILEVCF